MNASQKRKSTIAGALAAARQSDGWLFDVSSHGRVGDLLGQPSQIARLGSHHRLQGAYGWAFAGRSSVAQAVEPVIAQIDARLKS